MILIIIMKNRQIFLINITYNYLMSIFCFVIMIHIYVLSNIVKH